MGGRARACSLVERRESELLGGTGADEAEFEGALLCIRIVGLAKFELIGGTGVEGLFECEGAGRMSALLRGRGGGGSETTAESGPRGARCMVHISQKSDRPVELSRTMAKGSYTETTGRAKPRTTTCSTALGFVVVFVYVL